MDYEGSSAGFVVNADSSMARAREIRKWRRDPWHLALYSLNEALSNIDPDYTLVQVKEKFGRLCYYFSTDHPQKRIAMNKLVRDTEDYIDRLERQRRDFDKIAPPPGKTYLSDW